MKLKTLIAVAVAGAFAVPGVVLAQNATSQPQTGKTPPGAPASPGSIEQRAGTPSGSTVGTTSSGASASGAAALFKRLDRNNDGFISRDEAKDATELQGRFAELDQDNDGKISRSEMQGLDAGATGATSTGRRGGASTGMGSSSSR